MKSYILILAVILVCMGACHRKAEITVQSHTVTDSTRNWLISIEQPVFTSSDAGIAEKCDILNTRVRYLLDSLEQSLKVSADTFFAQFDTDTAERPFWNFELYIRDSVFMADENYISLRISAYTFQGGAHGMTDFYALNYDMKNGRLLEPRQILDYAKASEIDALLKKNFVNKDNCFTEQPTLKNGFTALNMTPSALCFTYPQYVLGPYSCGYAEVNVPRPELKNMLKLE